MDSPIVLPNSTVLDYMDMRSIEALKYGYRRITIDRFQWGSITYYHDIMSTKFVYATPYVFEPLRKGTGIFLEVCQKLNNRLFPILTLLDCNLTSWYKRKNIKYTCPNENNDIFSGPSYDIIKSYYEGKRAKRSGLPYINHIEEGLAIGVFLGLDVYSLEAYMLHPIFQDGKENDFDLSEVLPVVVQLAKDYTLVANAYLPYSGSREKAMEAFEKVHSKLHTLRMLTMDKVQNNKDFKLYNSNHPNAELLTKYFADWYDILQIPEEMGLNAERLITI